MAVLRRVPMLAHLSEKLILDLAKRVSPRALSKGEILFHEGQTGDHMSVLATGLLQVRARGSGGDAPVGTIYPGEVVGEMACIDPAPRAASVVASADSEVLELSAADLMALDITAPELAIGIRHGALKQLGTRLREANGRLDSELARRGLTVATPPEPTTEPESHETDRRVNLLEVPCLREFTKSELRTLVEIAPPRTWPAGRVLCREGEPGRCAFIVARGEVSVTRRVQKVERHLATLGAGALLGQLALLDRAPRSAQVRTTVESVILSLDREPFLAHLERQSPFAIRFQAQLAIAGVRQLRLATRALAGALTSDPDREKLAPLEPSADQTERLSYLRAATDNWSLDLDGFTSDTPEPFQEQ